MHFRGNERIEILDKKEVDKGIIGNIEYAINYIKERVPVEKLKSSILINNPGGLIPSFPREQFGNWSWPRNRLLADLLSRTIFMEKVGTGIRRIRKFCHENKNTVDIKPGDTYFSVEMKSPKVVEITSQDVGENVGEKLVINRTLPGTSFSLIRGMADTDRKVSVLLNNW